MNFQNFSVRGLRAYYCIAEDVLTEDKGECVICLEDLLKGHVIARLPCLCVYHKRYFSLFSHVFDAKFLVVQTKLNYLGGTI